MNIIGLNSNFVAIGNYSNFIELGWNRKYYECGDFSLYMRAEDYDENIKYLKVADDHGTRPETGIIQKLKYEEKINGDFITLSGFFLENWLNNYPTNYETYVGDSYYDAVNVEDITTYAEITQARYSDVLGHLGVPVTVIPQSKYFPSSKKLIDFKSFDKVGDQMYTDLQTQQMGMLVSYNNGYQLNLKYGEDKTNSVVFSRQLGNISSLEYTYDDSNLKTFCSGYADASQIDNLVISGFSDFCSDKNYYIRGSYGSGDKSTTTSVSLDGLSAPTGIEDPAAIAAAWQKLVDYIKTISIPLACQKYLLDYQNANNVESVVQQDVIYYISDYDLGDKVTINIDRMGVQYQARIIEVAEVWKENHQEFTLTFGNQIRQKKNI